VKPKNIYGAIAFRYSDDYTSMREIHGWMGRFRKWWENVMMRVPGGEEKSINCNMY
jgi:hypothetical protein